MRVHLPEIVVPGKRLGRHINHDTRSLRYLLPDSDTATSVEWERHTPILDQGDTGSCTGNAITGALGTGPLHDGIVADLATLPILDEHFALTVYSDAETLDGDGPYPPNDNGSSGLSVATVVKADGYISGYLHAVTLAAAHTALAAGPFITGTNWWSDMDSPTSEGIVTAGGTIRGGHEYLCRQYDAARDLWWLDNSWGTTYGVQGRFAFDSATFEALLSQQGDVTSMVPLNKPAPTPAPAPSPQPGPGRVDRSFTTDDVNLLDGWSAHKGWIAWASTKAAKAAWKRGEMT